ncbi:MAG TPA: cation:proton antiporter [Pyrinomonadaceae bacterium]|jgi:CPA2 family monovalent cation:H+ antiporter-2
MQLTDSLLLLFAGAVPHYLTEIVALIVAGAVIAYISFRLRLVPIVGFLLAGVLIGPNALGLVRDQEIVDATAEIGVILLLFTIGIEFSLEKLARIQRLIFGGGSLQVGLSALAVTGLLMIFGIDWRAALFTGFLVALSSTAIVLKILGDTGETNSEPGQAGLGLLIFQDLAIVAMVMVVPMLAAGGAQGEQQGGALGIVWALTKALLIIAAVLLVARRIMPKVLEVVAKTCSPELFLLTVIAICFGTAYLTSLAGVSLSLGAFLAGLLVSESRFSQHALGETLPLQILFSATFFVSVGMLLDLSFLISNLPLVLGAITVVLIIKILTTAISLKILGYKFPVLASVALMLAQIGEFSFVLERTGREAGITPMNWGTAGSQTFIAATVVLMIATPFLMKTGGNLSEKLDKKSKRANLPDETQIAEQIPSHGFDLEDHVIVAGYGQAARYLVRVLSGSSIPFIITTLNPDGANEAESEEMPVVRGDYSKQFLLDAVGISKAKMMVIADDNISMAHRTTMVARQLNPTMRIVVRTRYISDAGHLNEAGADVVIAEELESIVQLFGEVLRDYRIASEEIDNYEELARQNGYSALLNAGQSTDKSVFACQPGEDCFDTRTIIVRSSMPFAGKPLSSLNVLENDGLHVEVINRSGQSVEDLTQDFIINPGDELILSGSTEAFIRNADIFRIPNDSGKKNFDAVSVSANALPAMAADENKNEGNKFVNTEKAVEFKPQIDESVCRHLTEIRPVFPSADGCEDCLRIGDSWVHLRICLSCGHTGCCDSSKNKHAAAHFHQCAHPIIKSLEKGENWAWCYPDETYL